MGSLGEDPLTICGGRGGAFLGKIDPKLWNRLPSSGQFSNSCLIFKTYVKSLYKTHIKLL